MPMKLVTQCNSCFFPINRKNVQDKNEAGFVVYLSLIQLNIFIEVL